MLEHVFLWGRDRRIYGPSRKELERVVRSQRPAYLDTWLIGASDRLSSDAVALLEASLAHPHSSTALTHLPGAAGPATLHKPLFKKSLTLSMLGGTRTTGTLTNLKLAHFQA